MVGACAQETPDQTPHGFLNHREVVGIPNPHRRRVLFHLGTPSLSYRKSGQRSIMARGTVTYWVGLYRLRVALCFHRATWRNVCRLSVPTGKHSWRRANQNNGLRMMPPLVALSSPGHQSPGSSPHCSGGSESSFMPQAHVPPDPQTDPVKLLTPADPHCEVQRSDAAFCLLWHELEATAID